MERMKNFRHKDQIENRTLDTIAPYDYQEAQSELHGIEHDLEIALKGLRGRKSHN